MGNALKAWGHGHNPDGRKDRSDEPELSPELFRKMMCGEISAHDATRINREEFKSRKKANDMVRRQLGYQLAGDFDAEEFLAGETGDRDPDKPEAAA